MTADDDRAEEIRDWYAEDNPDGAQVLDAVSDWFSRFIRVTEDDDLRLLALWAAHTHLCRELYTTPRLQIDSTMPGSGKTTVLDHLNRLCLWPLQAATLSSSALLPRLLESGIRTILLDEVDRTLRADKPGVEDMLAVVNSGYRWGAVRPVLVPTKGGGWDTSDQSTFAPVAMAGNAPNLPADTMSRSIRILLMPDMDGSVEDSDWEIIETDATRLRDRIAAWAQSVRDAVKGLHVDLPKGCIGRSKEKWRPLKRVAVMAGGDWPAMVDKLIEKSLAEDAAEHEAGLKKQPPGVILLADLRAVWPGNDAFVPTKDLVSKLVALNPDYWGAASPYGKQLTEARLGKILSQAAKVTSTRPGGRGPRGYSLALLEPVWHRLKLGVPGEAGAAGGPGEPGADDNRDNRDNRMHRDAPGTSTCWCGYPPPPGRVEHFDCEAQRLRDAQVAETLL